jgi:hypothetical protein
MGHHGQPFMVGLSNEQTIKRITVMERELAHRLGMLGGYQKFYKAVRHNFCSQILAL